MENLNTIKKAEISWIDDGNIILSIDNEAYSLKNIAELSSAIFDQTRAVNKSLKKDSPTLSKLFSDIRKLRNNDMSKELKAQIKTFLSLGITYDIITKELNISNNKLKQVLRESFSDSAIDKLHYKRKAFIKLLKGYKQGKDIPLTTDLTITKLIVKYSPVKPIVLYAPYSYDMDSNNDFKSLSLNAQKAIISKIAKYSGLVYYVDMSRYITSISLQTFYKLYPAYREYDLLQLSEDALKGKYTYPELINKLSKLPIADIPLYEKHKVSNSQIFIMGRIEDFINMGLSDVEIMLKLQGLTPDVLQRIKNTINNLYRFKKQDKNSLNLQETTLKEIAKLYLKNPDPLSIKKQLYTPILSFNDYNSVVSFAKQYLPVDKNAAPIISFDIESRKITITLNKDIILLKIDFVGRYKEEQYKAILSLNGVDMYEFPVKRDNLIYTLYQNIEFRDIESYIKKINSIGGANVVLANNKGEN